MSRISQIFRSAQSAGSAEQKLSWLAGRKEIPDHLIGFKISTNLTHYEFGKILLCARQGMSAACDLC